MNITSRTFRAIVLMLPGILLTIPVPAQLFEPAVEYGTGYNPTSVAFGDLDGDGHQDLVITHSTGDSISILLGAGDGSFFRLPNTGAGSQPMSVVVGELNGDGFPDLVTANFGSDDVAVLLGRGDGTFEPAAMYPAGEDPIFLAIDDLDRDGSRDLVVVNQYSSSLSVLLGNGDGSMQLPIGCGDQYNPRSVAIDDLDGDGVSDLVVTNSGRQSVAVLIGNGDGSFQAPAEYPTGYTGVSAAIEDLDGDGFPDLAVAHRDSHNVGVLLGNGDGTFQYRVFYPVGTGPHSISAEDLDADGIPDLAVANLRSDDVSILLGAGDGTFQAAFEYEAGDDPFSLAIGDFTGNGAPDLAVTNFNGHSVSILLHGVSRQMLFTGPGPAWGNSPLVRVFPPEQDAAPRFEFSAYGVAHYGVNVASGDLDGDGVDEILTGAGPGEMYGPNVRGFEVNGLPLAGFDFHAYGTHKYGVNVAAGALYGFGKDMIITGAGPGAVFGPHVRGWYYHDGEIFELPKVNFMAYGTPKWGVNVAAGDIDGDGFDEIVTGAGPGAVYGPHVRGWNVDGGEATAMAGVSFLAYGTNQFGVKVSAGDVDGDGIDEIVTGAGPGIGFGPHVRGWNFDGSAVTPMAGLSFFAWQTPPLSHGVNVCAGADLNGDGRDELVVGRGPHSEAGSEVKVFTYDGATVSQWLSLEAHPGLTHGATVAAGRF